MESIKERRVSRKMSQQELSKKTGLSQAVISAYERGAKAPGARSINRLCDALGCTADELLGRKNEQKGET